MKRKSIKKLVQITCLSVVTIFSANELSAQFNNSALWNSPDPNGVMTWWNNEIIPFASSSGLSAKSIDLATATDMWNKAQAGDVAGVESIMSQLLGYSLERLESQTYYTSSPASSSVQLQNANMRNFVLSKAKTEKQEETAQQAAMRPAIGADAFYGYNDLTGGGYLRNYGVNLSAAYSKNRFEFQGTVPLYNTEFGGSDFFSYGFDAAMKYRLFDQFQIGFHGNIIGHSGDILSSYTWAIGPFVGYKLKLNNTFTLSLGTMFDYTKPELGRDAWIMGTGANLGIRLSDKIALNPYYIYSRDLDAPKTLDPDWHDFGLELSTQLGKTWNLNIGAKTTVDYKPYDYGFQVYIGSGWKF